MSVQPTLRNSGMTVLTVLHCILTWGWGGRLVGLLLPNIHLWSRSQLTYSAWVEWAGEGWLWRGPEIIFIGFVMGNGLQGAFIWGFSFWRGRKGPEWTSVIICSELSFSMVVGAVIANLSVLHSESML